MKFQYIIDKFKKISLLFCVIFFVGYILFSLRTHLTGREAFSLDYPEVSFVGELFLDTDFAVEEIKNLLVGENVLSKPHTFDVNQEKLKDLFLKLEWVKNVSIIKSYPSNLSIVIEPKKVIAYFIKEEKFFPIDSDGNILDIPLDAYKGILVSGDGGNFALPHFLEVMNDYPNILDRVVFLQYVNNLRWNVYLYSMDDTGLLIKFDNHDFEEGVKKIDFMDKNQDLLKRDIVEIDIRDVNKVLIKQRVN